MINKSNKPQIIDIFCCPYTNFPESLLKCNSLLKEFWKRAAYPMRGFCLIIDSINFLVAHSAKNLGKLFFFPFSKHAL